MEPSQMAVMIQHIKDASTLNKMFLKPLFIERDLLNVLYQIYMPLATLANTFTHYDLHLNNVLIYEPVKGKYIQYKYLLNDGSVVEFKSSYIAKIIDYGRSFFEDNSETGINRSSKSVYDTICQLEVCEPGCGRFVGYDKLAPESFPGSFYFISGIKRNISHDLRLLYNLINRSFQKINPSLYNLAQKITYGVGLKKDKQYGTKENIKSGLPNKIFNVVDAHIELKNMVKNNVLKNNNDYQNKELLGTFNIYQNGREMEFIPA
jgi:hypothetical protein